MSMLVIVIIILLLVTLFSVQNATPIAISFIFWKFEASLAIVIFLSVLTGIILGGVITLFIISSKNKGKKTNTADKQSKNKINI
ncbi:MAG: LapA family protein [Methanomicrobium sp.]|nr:LapA family protein [Methanomicrobium sp.]